MSITPRLQNTLNHVTDEFTPGKTIAFKAGITKATANVHLKELQALGMVEGILRMVHHVIHTCPSGGSKNKTLFWRLAEK